MIFLATTTTAPELSPDERRRRARLRAVRRRREEVARLERRRQIVRIVLGTVGAVGIVGAGLTYRAVRHSGKGLRETLKGMVKTVAVTTGVGPAGAAVQMLTERADEPMAIYTDALEEGWVDWSWATHSITSTTLVGSGSKGIQMELKGSDGVYFHHNPFLAEGYGALEFLFKGSPNAVMATVFDESNKPRRQLVLASYIQNGGAGVRAGWQRVQIPLKAFGVALGDKLSGVVLQCATPTTTGTVGIDEIRLLPDTTLPPPLTAVTIPVQVDAGADVHPISKYIYGVAHASKAEVEGLGATLNRWGGNPNSRHNWVINAWNSASDWEFRNHGPENAAVATGAGNAADSFIRDSRAAGAVSYMTVPTLGWVARNTDLNSKSEKVPWNTGPGIGSCDGPIPGYDPTDNRNRTSVRSVARKGRGFTLAPTAGETVYQDEWINHLVKTHGNAAGTGVRYYALDNEPDLWSFTHRDVHPGQMGYDDLWKNYLEYATAIKDVDRTALLAGPTVSGWTSYFYSALDRGNDNFATAADRKQHGNEPFLLWFLKQARAYDQKQPKGKRTLDILDVHYYPQGQSVYSDTKDPSTRALRLRSVRSLWDPTYKDESWIGGTADGPQVQLIPRLKAWIAQGYPGTKLSIGEWNFGGEEDISGGLATAEALGVFGRERVDFAAFWTRPKLGTPAAAAFQLFRRPEAGQAGFGEVSCAATTGRADRLAVFAATDQTDGALTLILVNKLPKATITVPLEVKGHDGGASKVWRFSAQNPGQLTRQSGPTVTEGKATLTLPPYSATLVRIGGRS